MTPSIGGPSAHYNRAQDAANSTTSGETPETSTTKPSEHSATDSSASLHGCLSHRTPYDEHTTWAYRQAKPDEAAAWQDAPLGYLVRYIVEQLTWRRGFGATAPA